MPRKKMKENNESPEEQKKRELNLLRRDLNFVSAPTYFFKIGENYFNFKKKFILEVLSQPPLT